MGRLAGWVVPKSEQPTPPVHLGAPRTMDLGMNQGTQERQQEQWTRLPGERIGRRLLRRLGFRPYRPDPIPRGQWKVEIIGQGDDPVV